jgi:hypothetical protein
MGLVNFLALQSYLEFLLKELLRLSKDISLATRNGMYYQFEGDSSHYRRPTINFLTESFSGRWIGRGGPIHRPPMPPDLILVDFFFGVYEDLDLYETNC